LLPHERCNFVLIGACLKHTCIVGSVSQENICIQNYLNIGAVVERKQPSLAFPMPIECYFYLCLRSASDSGNKAKPFDSVIVRINCSKLLCYIGGRLHERT